MVCFTVDNPSAVMLTFIHAHISFSISMFSSSIA